MPDRDTVVRGLHDIAGFIAGRIGIEQARNFLRTIDDALALLNEQHDTINELQNAYRYLQKQFFEVQDALLKEQEAKNVVNMTLSKDRFLIASCPKCNALLTRVEHKNYCGYCGQAVKW